MTKDEELTVDDLRYEWPENILTYETRFWMGLTLNDLLAAVLPFILAIAVLPPGIFGLILGAVAGLCGLLAVKKFDRFGGRGLVTYLIARAMHAYRQPAVELPVILPRSAYEQVTIQTWGGEELVSMGGGDGGGGEQ
jgi:hypothetical protein